MGKDIKPEADLVASCKALHFTVSNDNNDLDGRKELFCTIE